MKIVSWNINAIGSLRPVAAAKVEAVVGVIAKTGADIAILQEVGFKADLHRILPRALEKKGFRSSRFSGIGGSAKKRYGNLIVSKHPLRTSHATWREAAPWPQLFAHATASAPDGKFEVIGVHIPNGGGNGWAKVESFETLCSGLLAMPADRPFVVAGDFNEPQTILDDGTVIPFGMRKTKDEGWSAKGRKKGACERTFPRARWVRGVRSILGREPSVDLKHAWLSRGRRRSLPATHIIQSNGAERFFDHILVSRHWKVTRAGYDHDVRKTGLSDHSLAWAELELKA